MKKSLHHYKDGSDFFIKENSLVARLAAAKLSSQRAAIVIGKTVHLYKTNAKEFLNDNRWVKHELTHITQFRRYGFFRFIFLYLYESIRHGYFSNKFEIEAREGETNSGLEINQTNEKF